MRPLPDVSGVTPVTLGGSVELPTQMFTFGIAGLHLPETVKNTAAAGSHFSIAGLDPKGAQGSEG